MNPLDTIELASSVFMLIVSSVFYIKKLAKSMQGKVKMDVFMIIFEALKQRKVDLFLYLMDNTSTNL